MRRRDERGITILELIAVLGLSTVVLGWAVLEFRSYADPLDSGAAELVGYFKQVRAAAIS